MKNEGKWCYSFDEENYKGDFESKEEAIAEAILEYRENEEDCGCIWVGQTEAVAIGGAILEYLGVGMYEEAGEYAEEFLSNVSPKHEAVLEERLNEVLRDWMKEFKYEPNFFSVTNVQKIEVSDRRIKFI